MNVIFANPGWAIGFLILAILVLAVTIGYILIKMGEGGLDTGFRALVAFLTVLSVFFFWAFYWSSTHRVIEPLRSAIVVDRSTGNVVRTSSAGVTKIAWTELMYTYPANTNYQWCPSFTPSTKGAAQAPGAEVTVSLCFTLNAAEVPWLTEFQRYNGNDEMIFNGWATESVRSGVAKVISQFSPGDLTNQRAFVEKCILAELYPWLTSRNITFHSVSLVNWTFTSPAMNAAYEEMQTSIAMIKKATNEQQAALIQAQTSEIRKVSCTNAGFTSESACLDYLRLQWLQSLPSLPANTILNLGGASANYMFPAATTPAPAGGQ